MKLTNVRRDNLIKQIAKQKCEPMIKVINDKKIEFFNKFYERYFKEYKTIINKLPYDFFKHTNYFYLRFGNGYSESISVELDRESKYICVACWMEYGKDHSIKSTEFTEEEKEELKTLYKEEKAFERYKQDLISELKKVFYGCSTVNKLLTVFPEVKQFVEIKEENNQLLPVVSTDVLKKMLDID